MLYWLRSDCSCNLSLLSCTFGLDFAFFYKPLCKKAALRGKALSGHTASEDWPKFTNQGQYRLPWWPEISIGRKLFQIRCIDAIIKTEYGWQIHQVEKARFSSFFSSWKLSVCKLPSVMRWKCSKSSQESANRHNIQYTFHIRAQSLRKSQLFRVAVFCSCKNAWLKEDSG